MIKCTILLPTTDNNGEPFQDAAVMIDHALGKLYRIFGGYTDCGIVNGAYRMADGSRADDKLRKIIVCVDYETAVIHLRDVCGRLARLFSQETLYLEVNREASVEFVPAAERIESRIVDLLEAMDANRPVAKPADKTWRNSLDGNGGLFAKQAFDPPECRSGVQEYLGELSCNEVSRLKRSGATVDVYRHHGTVATVVRWPADNPYSHGGCELQCAHQRVREAMAGRR